MGTWMAHFRVAERLLERLAASHPALDQGAFLIGNVAPDSGRPNHDWTQFDPPKSVTHFLRPGEDEGRIRDLEFYREQVAPERHAGAADYSFRLGYFAHLVTDNLWMHLIGTGTATTFAAEFAQDRAATWGRVKDDWYGLDHKFLRDQPHNVYASRVRDLPNPPSPVPWLPTAALDDRLDDLRTFYADAGDFVLDREYPYLSEASMTRSVDDCASFIATLLERLEQGQIPAGARVSLKVLDPPEPYPLP